MPLARLQRTRDAYTEDRLRDSLLSERRKMLQTLGGSPEQIEEALAAFEMLTWRKWPSRS